MNRRGLLAGLCSLVSAAVFGAPLVNPPSRIDPLPGPVPKSTRFSHYIVYGRAGGGSSSRKRICGEFVAPHPAGGRYCPFVSVDPKVRSVAEAERLARKLWVEYSAREAHERLRSIVGLA